MSFMGAWRHFRTITKHRHKVIAHCFKAGIPWRGLMHDLSKYAPTEFLEGARYYQGTRSPNEKAREEFGCSRAWLHHQGRNRHHFEYWFDYNPQSHQREPVKMPFVFVLEMFCDRVAAGKIYMGKTYDDTQPLKYFLKAKPRRIIHPETSDLLESWLVMLAEKGEKETFRYLKHLRKTNPNYGKEDL